MKKGLIILGIAAFSINLIGNIVLSIKLSKVSKNSESEFVVLFNEYDRTTHQTIQNSDHVSEIKDEIKEISFRYTNEFSISTIEVYCKEGNTVYTEYADEVTYYNTNIDVIKNIVAEVQQVYSWMNISY